MAQTRRIFIDCDSCSYGQEVEPKKDDVRHLLSVLRLSEGAEVHVVCSTSGTEYLSIISTTNPDLKLRIIEELARPRLQSRLAFVAFALAKGDKNEFICEKACELGAKNVVLWEAEHSVAKLKQADRDKKISRLNKIIEAAAKQSGNTAPSALTLLSGVDELCAFIKGQSTHPASLLCSLAPDAQLAKDLPSELRAQDVGVIIGPEGDFSAAEEKKLRDIGAIPLSLGPTTLRCETAALVAMATVNALWGFSQHLPS